MSYACDSTTPDRRVWAMMRPPGGTSQGHRSITKSAASSLSVSAMNGDMNGVALVSSASTATRHGRGGESSPADRSIAARALVVSATETPQ